MNIVLRLATVETKLFFREKQTVFWTFVFPILMIWLFGAMFGDQSISGMSYSNAYIPSWIAVNLLTTSLFTLGAGLNHYREIGVLRRYQATPVRPWMIMASHTFYGILVFSISASILVFFGWTLYDLSYPMYLGGVLLTILLSTLALFPFGLMITSFVKSTRAAAAISSVMLNLMLFLSGATFPYEFMPTILQYVAKILPLYYVVDMIRGTWNFHPITEYPFHISFLLILSVVSTILASKFFRWSKDEN